MSETRPVQHRIAQLFLRKLKLDIPSADMDLFETGVLDSLAFAELLLHLEQEFGVRVSLERLDVDNFRSIAAIADFLVGQNGASGKPGAHALPG